MSRRYLFSSHDGFGLGHVRRNSLIARELLRQDPDARVALVTGVAMRPSWLGDRRLEVVHVPPLLKDSGGAYCNDELGFDEALARRAVAFDETIAAFAPDVVVVDRHPYGTAGELRPGLDRARRQGAAAVLGLRDVLDEPTRVRAEVAGQGWAGVAQVFDETLVYGERVLCDHGAEYGLPVTPRYCGWVVEHPRPMRRRTDVVVVTAGGGGDGDAVFGLGVDLARVLPDHEIVLVAGPYAAAGVHAAVEADARLRRRVRLLRDAPGCVALFAEAGGVVQMAGYNSTFESLAAGVRPVLVPRRSPRREQAIRASRLAALGVADVVDEGVPAEEVAWLLSRPRTLGPGRLAEVGVRLDGAERAATALRALVGVRAS